MLGHRTQELEQLYPSHHLDPMCLEEVMLNSSTLHSPTFPSGLQWDYSESNGVRMESKWTVGNLWDLNSHKGVQV
jgi:hypothetical protein